MSELKYKYPHILCNYKLVVPNININIREGNTPPTVSDNIIDLNGRFVYSFTIEDFTKDFNDAEYDSYNKVMIIIDSISSPIQNRLYIYQTSSGSNTQVLVPVTNTIEIPYSAIPSLKYIQQTITGGTNEEEVDYDIKFRVSDNYYPNPLYSSIHNLNIINSAYKENLPPTIGDISITADNRVTTILTLDMFTSGMQPPYNDPENDLIDAIRIDSISSANKGIFYYDNNPIQPGDIITREDIIAGLFTHIGADIDTLTGDTLTFSARDEGNNTWVQ